MKASIHSIHVCAMHVMQLIHLRSQLARQLWAQLALACFTWTLVVAVHINHTLLDDKGELDRHMRFEVHAVASILSNYTPTSLPGPAIDRLIGLLAEGRDNKPIAIQILDAERRVYFRSKGAPAEALRLTEGDFLNVEVAGERWQTLSLAIPDKGLLIVSAERSSERLRRGLRLIWTESRPALLLIPLFLLGAWLTSHLTVKPLHDLALSLKDRSDRDLRPVMQPEGTAEIKPVIDQMNRLLDAAGKAIATERAFLANAAHELKTPLAVIATQAHLMSSATTAQERRKAQRDLQAGLERTAHMVNQLLTMAALESTQQINAPQRLNLSELLAQRLALLSPLADRQGVVLILSAPDESVWISGVEDEWNSIVDNLVDNAIRYNRLGGRVEVELEKTADSSAWQLRVSDSGIGIPHDERERVFERFYRSRFIAVPGSGLGLSIVRQAAQRQGAQVYADDPRLRDADDRLVGTSLVVRLRRIAMPRFSAAASPQ